MTDRGRVLGDDRIGHPNFATELGRRLTHVAEQAFARFVPAAILGWLGVIQSADALRGAGHITANPSWQVAVDVMREMLYGAFMIGAAAKLSRSSSARSRDCRLRVFVASMSASFLLVGVGLLPTGPIAWAATVRSFQIGLLIATAGASFALAALVSLGSDFSILPEARSIVVKGPYRWIRHPIYLAETLMIAGIVLSDPRVTYLIGAVGVVSLQVYRIRVEEQLLSTTFPNSYQMFRARTRYRLLPGVW